MNTIQLDQSEIKKIIPHRDPMLLIDQVTAMIPEKEITATFYVDPARDIFRGHFPDDPVLPGVYTTECMAQASDILLLSMERYRGTKPLLISTDQVKFLRRIQPGDTIEIRASIALEKKEKAIVTCRCQVYNHGELAASGDVTLAMR